MISDRMKAIEILSFCETVLDKKATGKLRKAMLREIEFMITSD
jgi:hypothetical protein